MPKLRFPQYKVRGNHRDYYMLAFLNYPYMWPNYEKIDEEYIIDTDAICLYIGKLGWLLLDKYIEECFGRR